MSRQKISTAKIANIEKLIALGYTQTKVAEITGVSRVTVYYRTNEEFRKKELVRKREQQRARAKLAVQVKSASVSTVPDKWTTE